MSKYWNWIAGGGLIAVLSLALWGVPYFISSSVSDAVAAEINAREELQGKSVDVQALELQNRTIITQLANMSQTDARIEGKLSTVEQNQQEFGRIFMGYLERQAQ